MTDVGMTFDAAYFTGGRSYSYENYHDEAIPALHYANATDHLLREHGYDPTETHLLIVGCAFGYTVKWLRTNFDVPAFGQELSAHAVEESVVPDAVVQGDARETVDTCFADGETYDLVLTEGLLSCLSDEAAQQAVGNCRAAGDHVWHRVWSIDGSGIADAADEYNAKSLADWQTLCDPDGVDTWFHDHAFHPTLRDDPATT